MVPPPFIYTYSARLGARSCRLRVQVSSNIHLVLHLPENQTVSLQSHGMTFWINLSQVLGKYIFHNAICLYCQISAFFFQKILKNMVAELSQPKIDVISRFYALPLLHPFSFIIREQNFVMHLKIIVLTQFLSCDMKIFSWSPRRVTFIDGMVVKKWDGQDRIEQDWIGWRDYNGMKQIRMEQSQPLKNRNKVNLHITPTCGWWMVWSQCGPSLFFKYVKNGKMNLCCRPRCNIDYEAVWCKSDSNHWISSDISWNTSQWLCPKCLRLVHNIWFSSRQVMYFLLSFGCTCQLYSSAVLIKRGARFLLGDIMDNKTKQGFPPRIIGPIQLQKCTWDLHKRFMPCHHSMAPAISFVQTDKTQPHKNKF